MNKIEVLQEALYNLSRLNLLIQKIDTEFVKNIKDDTIRKRFFELLPYKYGCDHNMLDLYQYSESDGQLVLMGQYNDACNCHPEYQDSQMNLPIAYALMNDEEVEFHHTQLLMASLDKATNELMSRQIKAKATADKKAQTEALLTKEYGPAK